MRKRNVKVVVVWLDGSKQTFVAYGKEEIQQHYRQLNILTDVGAVAVNLAATRFVQIDHEDVDFNEINVT